MEKKGETAGAECGMFYGSYVFFEKMRIWEGKGKGVRRVRSEVEYVFSFPSRPVSGACLLMIIG